MGEDTILSDGDKVHQLSETAGFIYINAGKADSTEELAGLVAEEYDVPKSEVLEDVKAVVKTLQQKGILL